MPGPNPFPCGKEHQPACPPDHAIIVNGVKYYTIEQMQEHGHANYQKGLRDANATES